MNENAEKEGIFVVSSERSNRAPPPVPGAVPAHAPAQPFVAALYRAVLGREAGPAGRAGWVAFLQAGGTRPLVAHGFWNSPEHRGLPPS